MPWENVALPTGSLCFEYDIPSMQSLSIHNNNKHQIASRQQTDFKNHNFRKNKIITDHDVRSYAYGDDNDYWGCTIVHKM